MSEEENKKETGLVTLSTVCMHPVYDKEKNINKYLNYIKEAASKNARLIAFPESSLQGYIWGPKYAAAFSSTPEALKYQHDNAEYVPGPTTDLMIEQAKENNMYIVWGMTEKAAIGGGAVLYDTAVLVGPEGLQGAYRKVHIAGGEEYKVYSPGSEWPVFDTGIGKIGMLICYDMMFPEPTRELALQGAEILVMPTAWVIDTGVDPNPDVEYLYPAYQTIRAAENQTIFISANCIGTDEKAGWHYYGHSSIVSPNGSVISSTGFKEGLATADVNVKAMIQKGRVEDFGGLCLLRDRQPSTYKLSGDTSIYYPPYHY